MIPQDEVSRWMHEAAINVDPANNTSGIISEASSRLREEVPRCKTQAEDAQMQWEKEKERVAH